MVRLNSAVRATANRKKPFVKRESKRDGTRDVKKVLKKDAKRNYKPDYQKNFKEEMKEESETAVGAVSEDAKDAMDTESCSVFVRDLPFKVTGKELSDLFTSVAKPRHAFIVKDKITKNSKGFGFVEFYNKEDRDAAVRKIHNFELEGRRISVVPSIASSLSSQQRKGELVRQKMNLKVAKKATELKEEFSVSVKFTPSIIGLTKERALVLISCLLPKSIPVTGVFNANEDDCPYDWLFQFESIRKAASVAELFDQICIPIKPLKSFLIPPESLQDPSVKGVVMDCSCLVASVVKAVQATTGEDKGRSSAQLVIRNLSFQASEQQLFHILKKFGVIRKMRLGASSKLKKKEEEKKAPTHGGYAFVYYREASAANAALKELNGKQFFGKKLVVDWAIQPEIYSELKQGLIEIPKPDFARLSGYSLQDESDEEDNADSVDLKEELENTELAVRKILEGQSCNLQEEKIKSLQKIRKVASRISTYNSEINLKAEDNEENSASAESLASAGNVVVESDPPKKDKREEDVSQGKTIHIRNLPFSIESADLKDAMTPYGEVVYVRLVKNAQGEQQGTAFVKFQSIESVERILAEEQRVIDQLRDNKGRSNDAASSVPVEGLGVYVNGRRIRISKAVTKGEVATLAETRKNNKIKSDKRVKPTKSNATSTSPNKKRRR